MFEGKALLRLVVQKSRTPAPLVPMRSAPAYLLSKWGVKTRSGYSDLGVGVRVVYSPVE
jgi:hypothetical protein